MSSDTSTTSTKSALGILLRKLNICKVVCVDDEHAPALELTDILGWLDGASPDDVANLFPTFEGRSQADLDVRKELFQGWWEGLDQADRDNIAEKVRSSIQEEALEESPDTSYMSVLSEVFEEIEGVSFLPIGPKDWEDKSEELLSSTDSEGTLFLFDQDMSKQGGRTNEGSTIVGNILKREMQSRPLCGILTHTATTDQQKQRWDELADEAGVTRDEFMVIPKSLLTDDLQEFTIQIKSAILAPAFRKLKELSENILSLSLLKATEELKQLTVLDFDHMVMRVAHGEGLWEGQILFRLHSHFHHLEAVRQARQNRNLSDLIQQIRKVSGLPEFGMSKASNSVRTIRHAELYENGEIINKSNMDVAMGDIFECAPEVTPEEGESKTLWMVSTQACDLMLRPDGERNSQQILLLKIEKFSKSQWKNNGKRPRYSELEYFDCDSDSAVKAVDFLSTSFIPSWVLDICVLNDEGESMIRLDARPPKGLLPAWSIRFGKVIADASKFCERYNLSLIDDEAKRTSLLKLLSPTVSSCGSILASTTSDVVNIPLRRVKRLRLDAATEIVRQYAAYIARTPTEVDLARSVKCAAQ